MDILLFFGLFIPLFGTSLGAVFVMFSKSRISGRMQFYLNEFAGGVMMAASVFSLLLPAIEQSKSLGKLSVFPACTGFWLGIFFLAWMQKKLPCQPEELARGLNMFIKKSLPEEKTLEISGKAGSGEEKLWLLLLAIVIHNIPEGMAVGASFADCLSGGEKNMILSSFVLSVGIAVQNIPEGAIISLPLYANGMKKGKACVLGVLSGVVEPVAGFLTLFLSGFVLPVLPYLLGFSAGAMVYVVVNELLSGTEEKEELQMGTFLFAAGFSFMMVLDVVFG